MWVQRANAPITQVMINLEQFEDRKVEEGPVSPDILLKESSEEPECFELRAECGFVVLNKGELKKLGKAFLELADEEDLGCCWLCRTPLTRPGPGRIGCLRCDDSMDDALFEKKVKELERMSLLMEAVKKIDSKKKYLSLHKSETGNPNSRWSAEYPGDAFGNSSPSFEALLLSLAEDL